MTFLDHIIHGDYWTRIKVGLVLGGITFGTFVWWRGQQRWGLWIALGGTALFVVMLIQKFFAHEPSTALDHPPLPWWLSTEHWDGRVKAIIVVGLFMLGMAMERLSAHHLHRQVNMLHGLGFGVF